MTQLLNIHISESGSESLCGLPKVMVCVESLDVRVAGDLYHELRPSLGRTSVVDLSHVAIVDSAGLGALVAASRELRDANRRLTLVGVQPQIQRLFDDAGLADMFECSGAAED